MTVSEAIARCDAEKPNTFSNEDKIRWLNDLDGRIWYETILEHDDIPETAWEPYTGDSMAADLLACTPYEEVYPLYLEMKIDLANGDTARYDNSHTMLNTILSSYRNFYNRQHKPKQRTVRFK